LKCVSWWQNLQGFKNLEGFFVVFSQGVSELNLPDVKELVAPPNPPQQGRAKK